MPVEVSAGEGPASAGPRFAPFSQYLAAISGVTVLTIA